MTNLMLEGELKKNNINFKDGDTFSFKDNIFDYSEDKNVRKLAKLRRKMLKTMNLTGREESILKIKKLSS